MSASRFVLGQPLGHAVKCKDTKIDLVMTFELDNFGDVPMARQAYAHAKSGHGRSVQRGFLRLKTRDLTPQENNGTHLEFVKARLDECAMTLQGAVPGTKAGQHPFAQPAPWSGEASR